MKELEKDWPPSHSVRRSRKAGRISLRVSDERGLEVVLPEKARQPDIASILERHRDWILRQLTRRAARLSRRDALHTPSPFSPPAGFWLHGGELRVDLDIGRGLGGAAMQELLSACALRAVGGAPAPGVEIWPLAEGPEEDMLRRLRLFIKSYAKAYLGASLRRISREHSLPYSRAAFASQKSRWGSYAPDGSVRLNNKLVFLPVPLSDCVILHELCHGVHGNHGPHFHALMQEKDPELARKNAELRNAGTFVPIWFI